MKPFFFVSLFAALVSLNAHAAKFNGGQLVEQVSQTTTAGGSTALTAASNMFQRFVGSSNQNVVMPDATTMQKGTKFIVSNAGSGNVTVLKHDGSTTIVVLPANTASQFYVVDISTSNGTWDQAQFVGSGTGSVLSVSLGLPASTFSISGSPVTTSGTLTGAFTTQTANVFLAGPTSGIPATPTWRVLVNADMPTPTLAALGGVEAINSASHQFINSLSTSGILGTAQPAFSDLSGNIATGQMNSGTSATSATFWRGDGVWATPSGANPMSALGDTIYGGASGTETALSGNTTSTKKFLTQTGTGTVSAAPGWNQILAADLPSLSSQGMSVGLSMPAEFSVANSPVTGSATLTVTKATQSANTVYAGPSSGAAAAPTFRSQVYADLSPGLKAPTFQALNSTGTQTGWVFTVSSASATVGATYTNNGNTYTVQGTISAGTTLFMSGTGATSGTTLTKSAGTGDATITFSAKIASATYTTPSGPAPLYLEINCVGAGGGGGYSGNGATGTAATTGGTTYFGAGMVVAGGGSPGAINGSLGGSGGTGSLGTAIGDPVIAGGMGAPASGLTIAGMFTQGGQGGASCLGGEGSASGGTSTSAPAAGAANSGGGGGGAMTGTTGTGQFSGSGGGAGACVRRAVITSPTASYPYVIGAAGSGGISPAGGLNGANGGTGGCSVKEVYQ